MSSFRTIQLFFIISFFPVWIVRSNLTIYEILFTIILLVIVPFFIVFSIFKEKYYPNNYFLYLISLIFIYGADNHLGLRSGIDNLIHAIFDIEHFFDHGLGIYKYFAGIIFLFTFSLIIFILIKISDFKFVKILLIFTLSIGLFSFFDNSKNYKQFVEFEKAPKIKEFEKTTLVLVFDAMSGIDSFESKNFNGEKFLKISDIFFKKYNFNVYNKAKTVSTWTIASFINFTNFSTDIKYSDKYREFRDSLNNGGYYLKTENYFQVWKQVKNLFFEKFNQVSVYQGMATNYCEVDQVYKCDTYNPFKQRVFMEGFKNTILTRVISIYQMNGSIIGHTTWRVLRQLRIIDSIAIPEGEKPALPQTLKKIEKDIYSQKYDLIFVHTLVPHLPFGYDSECKYDGSLSFNTSFMDMKKKIQIHNNERICIINFLDKFLSNIKKNKRLNNLDIIILSDHGLKAVELADDLRVFLIHRNSMTEYLTSDKKITIQEFFSNYFNK